MLGIYAYFDRKDNSVAYVGKDSNINKSRRNKEHHSPSQYYKQPFNRILQKNPNRYTYQVLVWNVKDQETLNALEIQNIRQLKPKFNYTDGGDGMYGYKASNETKKKMSQSHKGKTFSDESKKIMSDSKKGEKNPMFGKRGEKSPRFGRTHSEHTKQKIREFRKGSMLSKETKNKISEATKGKRNPNSKYSLWDINSVYYNKRHMIRDNREPNPCKCFYLKYNGYDVPCGGFVDFTSVEIINDLFNRGDVI